MILVFPYSGFLKDEAKKRENTMQSKQDSRDVSVERKLHPKPKIEDTKP